MFKKVLIMFFFLGLIAQSTAQHSDRHRLALLFKQYQLDKVALALQNIPENSSKQVYHAEYEYLKNGVNKDFGNSQVYSFTDYIDSILFYNYSGDFYWRRKAPNDHLAFSNYLKGLAIAEKYQDTLFINESLRRINRCFKRNFKDQSLYQKYIDKIPGYEQDNIDQFWRTYYNLVYEMSYSTDEQLADLESKFLKLAKHTPEHQYFKGIIYHMIGILYTYTGVNNKESKDFFSKALATYNDEEYYSYSRKIKTQIALDIAHYDDQNYRKAIAALKTRAEDIQVKEDLELKWLIYDWISKSYEKLSVADSSLHYAKQSNLAKDSLEQYKMSILNHDAQVKYETQKKEIKINKLEELNQDLKKNVYSFIPIIVALIALLLFIYYLYKRYQKKSAVLEEEKSETLQKLDELKNIVIKNHIILKDKTKVYIADLMYIKSDDHYLNIYTSEGKNHFVRGKISQIKEELPPNFIQCHRSYIVNTNFIKQYNKDSLVLIDKTNIPVSRSYKDRLK